MNGHIKDEEPMNGHVKQEEPEDLQVPSWSAETENGDAWGSGEEVEEGGGGENGKITSEEYGEELVEKINGYIKGRKQEGKNRGKAKRKRQVVEVEEKNEDALYKFPMNRVSRIIRSEISNVRLSQEAVFVINRASEKFLDLFSREAYACPFLDRKSYIAYDHLSSVVSKRKRFDFVSGDNNESRMSNTIENALKGTGVYSSMKLKEDMEQDDEALFDTNEEYDSVLNDQSVSEACMMSSTFDSHVNYKLSSREVDELLKMKWSYTWKMPAFTMKNCNWRGTGECCIQDLDLTSYYGLKTKLYKNWMGIFKASGSSGFHQSKQKMFFSLCNSYYDIMHHNKKPFYLKGLEEDSNIMDGYLMHSLNHVLRSRDLMSKNDRKLAKHHENMEGKSLNAEAYLDRGFTRPKILILLPLAGIARRVIKKLIQLTPPKLKGKVENIQRFYEEFGSGITKDDQEDDEEDAKTKMSTKPSDFDLLLGRDNNNDQFMIGVKFTHRGIKMYGDFYTSDILVASPLGLITKIGEAELNKEKDVDYLSSIEILIIDHADVMLMQNWSHVKTVVEQLNQLPSKQRGTDIMRIRPWYLDEQARFYRQTILLSSHINPDFNVLFHQHCFNYQGKVKLECKYRGVLPKILTQVQQIYERFDTESVIGADESRLQYFSKMVFPKIKDSIQHGVMIFVSSYFEFVRLRNYLKSQAASFCLFGEYIKPNYIAHVRGQFFRGEKRIMLYTERAHFYYRYKIRGVKNLLIYSLPERKEFYHEIVNFLEPSADMTCTILFSRLDYLRLERVVGSTAAKRMVDSDKGVFVFA